MLDCFFINELRSEAHTGIGSYQRTPRQSLGKHCVHLFYKFIFSEQYILLNMAKSLHVNLQGWLTLLEGTNITYWIEK